MSTNKHIDVICAAAIVLSVLLAVLFMNGRSLGITSTPREDEDSGMFTKTDLDGGWDASGAVKLDLGSPGAYSKDGGVYIASAGKYVLTGSLANGSVVIEAGRDDKVWLMLDGADIHCENAPAVYVKNADKVILTLAGGSENSLSTGKSASDEKLDGAVFSRDDLTINGPGSLTINGAYKHGIVCNDDLVITGGSVEITASQDGIHAHDSVRVREASLTITAGDDGITCSNDDETSFVLIESGSVRIPACYEGIEAANITVSGGDVEIYPTDDGINGCSNDSLVKIDGGSVTIINRAGRDADGIDSNHDIEINGGTLFISVPANGGSCSLDCGTETGGSCKINGGTVIACGGSSMMEAVSKDSAQGFIMKTVTAQSAETPVSLKGGDGRTLCQWTVPCGFTSVIISADGIKPGDTVILTIGGSSESVTIDNSSPSSGFGGGGGRWDFGGGNKRDFGDGQRPNGGRTEPDGRVPGAGKGGFDPGADFRRPGADDKTRFPDGPDAPQFPGSPEAAGLPETPQLPGTGLSPDDGDPPGGRPGAPWTLVLTAASLLVLAAGIIVAAKKKY